MSEEDFERAKADTLRALTEKHGPEAAEKIWADLVAGIRREVARAIVESEARDSGSCGNPDCNLCRDDVAHSRSDDDEGGPDTDS